MCRSMFCAIPCFWRGGTRKRAIKCFCSCPSSGWRPARSGRFSRGSAGIWRSRRLCRARYSAHTLRRDGLHPSRRLHGRDRRRALLPRSCAAARNFERLPRRQLRRHRRRAACAVSDGALCFGKDGGEPLTLVLLPAVSRCGSALAVTALRPMSTSQYAAQKKPKSHIIVLCAQLAVYLAAGFLAGWRTGRRSAAVLLGTRSRSGKRSACSTA